MFVLQQYAPLDVLMFVLQQYAPLDVLMFVLQQYAPLDVLTEEFALDQTVAHVYQHILV